MPAQRPSHPLKNSIRAQVLALALGFAMLIALGISVASVYTLDHNTRQASGQAAEYALQVTANNLSQNIEEIDNLADWSTVNSTVRSFVLSNYRAKDLVRDIYDTVFNKYSAMHTAKYLQRYIITDGDTRIMQLGTVTAQSRALSSETMGELPCIGEGAAASWTAVTTDPLQTFGAAQNIPVLRDMSDPVTGRSAKVYLSVSVEMITDVIQDYGTTDGVHLYWMMGGQVYTVGAKTLTALGSAESVFTPAHEAAYPMLDSASTVWQYEGQTVIAYPVDAARGLYIAQTVPRISVFEQLPSIRQSLFGSLIALLALGILLGILLQRTIAKPINAIKSRLSLIAGGDFSTDPGIEWNNEMGDIGRGINDLSRSVTALMETRLEDEKQKQDLEYRMLQNQINPHFLYNTLNSIKWMATIQHAPGIAEMTTALSRLLKSVSKGNERLVPLVEEFALLNDYFTIQQYRYGGTVTMDVSYIEDESLCQDCMIPRFTLQPLVENAIFHGIEPKGCAGNVDLIVKRDAANGDVLIALADDGVGMTGEQIKKALTPPGPEEEAAKFRHVGMWNVHRRLQYSFGPAYGLSITSTIGSGTTVTVRLPYTKKKEEP